MKQFMGGLLLLILGVVIGTAGSDDSLLNEARQQESSAFRRGRAAAAAELRATAVQLGYAKWLLDPHTGQKDHFAWQQPRQEAEITAPEKSSGIAVESLQQIDSLSFESVRWPASIQLQRIAGVVPRRNGSEFSMAPANFIHVGIDLPEEEPEFLPSNSGTPH